MRYILFVLISVLTLSCSGQEFKKEYPIFIKEIINKRDSFMTEYAVSNAVKKDAIVQDARDYLIDKMVNELFPYWFGTKWDFNGTTRTPKKGTIACGYFITNILTDVGFVIPRVKWAQSPSEVFIKKLAPKNIKRFSNKSIQKVEKYLIDVGNGLYIVGLDSHTGFIHVQNTEVRFIHADYYEPEKGVVSEELDSYSPIADSAYRVIGKLMSDEMIISWIKKQRIH